MIERLKDNRWKDMDASTEIAAQMVALMTLISLMTETFLDLRMFL